MTYPCQPHPGGARQGFGFFSPSRRQFRPCSLLRHAGSWSDGKLKGVLEVDLNGQPFGRADAGDDMTFDFGTLISHAAKTRSLGAGTIIGSGTVSNRDSDGGPGRPVADGGLGYSCIAEVRMVETILGGKPRTPFLSLATGCRSPCAITAHPISDNSQASSRPAKTPAASPQPGDRVQVRY